MTKLRGGDWLAGRVVGFNPTSPMAHIEVDGMTKRAKQTKLRKNLDMWHDVDIPGLDRPDGKPTVPEAIEINGNQTQMDEEARIEKKTNTQRPNCLTSKKSRPHIINPDPHFYDGDPEFRSSDRRREGSHSIAPEDLDADELSGIYSPSEGQDRQSEVLDDVSSVRDTLPPTPPPEAEEEDFHRPGPKYGDDEDLFRDFALKGRELPNNEQFNALESVALVSGCILVENTFCSSTRSQTSSVRFSVNNVQQERLFG